MPWSEYWEDRNELEETMELSDVIQYRVSVRNYDPEKQVPKEVLKRILEAGRLAPSATNAQPWKFLVISSAEMRSRVHESYTASWFRDAPIILVVTGSRKDAWTRSYDGYNSLETDLTIAMDHMILAAENEGVGTCWIEAYDPAKLRSALSLAEDDEVFSITPLGYPRSGFVKQIQKKRKPLEEIVTFL